MKKWLTALTILASFAAHANSVSEVKALLDKTVYSCPDRIWKGVDWRGARITLLSPTRGEGIVLQHGKAESVDAETARQFSSAFDFEKNGLVINVDSARTPEEAFALLVHEGFHAFGQKDFEHTTQGRNETYPAPFEPRLEREELTRNLIAHFRGEPEALERAAAWHMRHKSHKEDLGSDVIEGSAEYVEKIATAIAKLGCDAEEKDLVAQAVEALAEQGAAFDKEYEHYRIGALSFLLARPQLQKVLSNIDDENLPLDIVFKNIKASKDISADPLIEHVAEMTVGMANRRAEEVILPVREHLKSGETFIFVPMENLVGSFEHRGAYASEGVTYYQALSLNTKNGSIEGHGFRTKACGDRQGFMVVSDAPIGPGAKTEKFKDSVITCW
jgi:hypothetical protein